MENIEVRRRGRPRKVLPDANAAIEGADALGNGSGWRKAGAYDTGEAEPYRATSNAQWVEVRKRVDELAGARLPAVITDIYAPDIGETMVIHHHRYGGARLNKGPARIRWSDGYTEDIWQS